MNDRKDWVGPVLQASAVSEPILQAIRELNPEVEVIDRGAYFHVLVPKRCRVTRDAIERKAGRAFRLPGDLEAVMVSFKGRLAIDSDEAIWDLST